MLKNERRGLVFLSLLLAGVLLFLATDNAVIGAVLPSAYAGWKSCRTGLWILRADQVRSRARIAFSFCLAAACWQAAAAALLSVLGFMIAETYLGKPPQIDHIAATMLTLTGAVALTTLLGLAASVAAAAARIRVWVHPRLPEMVRGDLDRVVELPAYPGFNYAVFVLATSVAFPLLALSSSLLLITFGSVLYALFFLIVGPLFAFVGYLWFAARVIALHPAECWTHERRPA